MARSTKQIAVYFEASAKRTFANARDWPGWARSGRDEDAALEALLKSAPRYEQVLHAAHIAFSAPKDIDDFDIVDRIKGGPSTDFGVPEQPGPGDDAAIDTTDLRRLQKLLRAYWQAFDAVVKAAHGKELRKGPRGGGRELDGIIEHVVGAQQGYLRALGQKVVVEDGMDQIEAVQQATVDAVGKGAHGDLPKQGPRGGKIWLPRYFVRRSGWHILDHIWEIEDRQE